VVKNKMIKTNQKDKSGGFDLTDSSEFDPDLTI
jgi:hypothetical protein